MRTYPLRNRRSLRPGFSLVEVLLAILILGIGVVSIAALFPAGIAQQRLSNDDVMGPIVANNAISLIRAKVRQEDFGTFEEFQQYFMEAGGWNLPGNVPQGYFSRTLPGDWDWMRPAFLLSGDQATDFDERGAIDVFSHRFTLQRWGTWGGPTTNLRTASELAEGFPEPAVWSFMGGGTNNHPLYGIPYNTEIYGNNPPNFIISQRERYYPMQSGLANNDNTPRPQYVWECMFRRYQGRVFVAVFVYRISSSNTAARYIVPADPDTPVYPPLPYRLNLPAYGAPYGTGARNVWYDPVTGRDQPFMRGTENANDFYNDPDRPHLAWQRTRQWLLDQNNNVHRVVGVDRDPGNDNFLRVELTRPLQPVMTGWYSNDTFTFQGLPVPWNNVSPPSDSPDFYLADPSGSSTVFPYCDIGVVTDLWYIPRSVEVVQPGGSDPAEFTLTPVYVTVKEL